MHQSKGLEVTKHRLLEMFNVIEYYDKKTDMVHGAIRRTQAFAAR